VWTSFDLPVAVGDLVAGKFRVERVLGVGGMGVVVEALHLDLNRRVALKFMLGEAVGCSEAVERFLREGRAAARLQSEHVARVLDVGRLDSGEPYMVMELLQGHDLAQYLTQNGPVPVALAVSLVLQACEAIAEAHAAGIVHRDLKPSNLFLTRGVDSTPLLKVLDFGISKLVKGSADPMPSKSITGALLGSPAYMSPEQVRNAKNVDTRTDIWSLGLILYELLVKQSAFSADSLPGLIAAIAIDSPTPMRARRPELTAPLEAVVMRCLQKDPSARFATVADLARALEPFTAPEDTRLVARIVRLQKSAGLTDLDTTPLGSLDIVSKASFVLPPTHVTAASFGVTSGAGRKSAFKLLLAFGLIVLLPCASAAAWWTNRQRSVDSARAQGIPVLDGGRPLESTVPHLASSATPQPAPRIDALTVPGDAGAVMPQDSASKPHRFRDDRRRTTATPQPTKPKFEPRGPAAPATRPPAPPRATLDLTERR
jgi:serine/threonine-protein kinase